MSQTSHRSAPARGFPPSSSASFSRLPILSKSSFLLNLKSDQNGNCIKPSSSSLPLVLSPSTVDAATTAQRCSPTLAKAESRPHSRCTLSAVLPVAPGPTPHPLRRAGAWKRKVAPSPAPLQCPQPAVPAAPDNSRCPAAAAPPPH